MLPVWTRWGGEKSCPYRNSNSDPSAVFIYSTISILIIKKMPVENMINETVLVPTIIVNQYKVHTDQGSGILKGAQRSRNARIGKQQTFSKQQNWK
jgi:hypothetical protein